MDPQSVAWAPVWSLVGVALGSLGQLVAQAFTHREAAQRERESRQQIAADRRHQWWGEFQVRSMIELQDALLKLLDEPNRTATEGKVEAMRHRVPDEQLASLVDDFIRSAEACDDARHGDYDRDANPEDIRDARAARYGEMRAAHRAAHNRIGELLKGYRPAP